MDDHSRDNNVEELCVLLTSVNDSKLPVDGRTCVGPGAPDDPYLHAPSERALLLP